LTWCAEKAELQSKASLECSAIRRRAIKMSDIFLGISQRIGELVRHATNGVRRRRRAVSG
jgi:hypothetical protein